MSEPCFKCGAAGSCRHREAEVADRAHVVDRVDRRALNGKFVGAHGNLAGPARVKIQSAIRRLKGAKP